MAPGCITVFGIWMSDGNQLPPAGETACPTYFAKRLIQEGGAGGFACRSNGHNQWSASKMNKFPKTVMHPKAQAGAAGRDCLAERMVDFGKAVCTRPNRCRIGVKC